MSVFFSQYLSYLAYGRAYHKRQTAYVYLPSLYLGLINGEKNDYNFLACYILYVYFHEYFHLRNKWLLGKWGYSEINIKKMATRLVKELIKDKDFINGWLEMLSDLDTEPSPYHDEFMLESMERWYNSERKKKEM